MEEGAARGRIAHGAQASSHPLVADVGSPLAVLAVAVQPGITAPGSQDQVVEVTRTLGAEQWKMQLSRTVTPLEGEAKGVFGGLFGVPAHPPVNPQAAIHTESALASMIQQLHGSRPFPASATLQGMKINAGV